MNPKDLKFWYAVFALVGTTIGAGIFGLPFVFFKAGFLVGLAELLVLTSVIILVQQIFGEIALRTRGKKRLVGYDEEYLGSVWKFFSALAVIFGASGAVLVYVILGGEFLAAIFGTDKFFSSLAFFAVWFLAILARPKTFGRFEFYIGAFAFFIIIILPLFSLGYIDLNNLKNLDLSNSFLPYGVILFAIAGYSVIPEMEEILGDQKNKLRKAIVLGTLIPVAVYLIFTFTVVGVSGSLTSRDAISGLALATNSQFLLIVGSFLGLLTVSGAALSQGVFLKETFIYDLKIRTGLAWALTGVIPLTVFLLGARDFLYVVGLVGAVIFGFRVVDVLLIHKRAKKSEITPAYEINLSPWGYYALGSLAILGAILEIWYIISK